MIPDELRHAFPEPDERFQACVRRTLDALAQEDAQKERLPMKRTHLRVGVLIAVAVLLLSTIGVAAASLRYGVFDFLRGADGSPAALPEASALVQTEVPQTAVPQAGAPAAALHRAACLSTSPWRRCPHRAGRAQAAKYSRFTPPA